MPRCYICDTHFEDLSWSGPSEPCDCGIGLSHSAARETDPDHLHEMDSWWKRYTKDEAAMTTHADELTAWAPSHATASERHAIEDAQAHANTNQAPVGVWHRDGWYTVCETPPEMLEPDPETLGWTIHAVVDPEPCA